MHASTTTCTCFTTIAWLLHHCKSSRTWRYGVKHFPIKIDRIESPTIRSRLQFVLQHCWIKPIETKLLSSGLNPLIVLVITLFIFCRTARYYRASWISFLSADLISNFKCIYQQWKWVMRYQVHSSPTDRQTFYITFFSHITFYISLISIGNLARVATRLNSYFILQFVNELVHESLRYSVKM